MNWNLIIALALIGIVIVLIVMWVIPPGPVVEKPKQQQPPPDTRKASCIQVQEVSNEDERKSVADLSAKLELVKLDASLKADFEQKSKVVFATLTEKEIAFLLLLRAIDCYLEKADTPEKKDLVTKILPELLAIARDMWASSRDLKGAAGARLSLKERDLLEQSAYGKSILGELKKRGVTE
jgi:hypothetical protein